MERGTGTLVNREKEERVCIFIDKMEREDDFNKKKKLLIDMLTYQDKIVANEFIFFLMDIINDKEIYSRDQKIIKKIVELNDLIDGY